MPAALRRPLLACAGMLAALTVLIAIPPGATADDESRATTLLDRARGAATGHEFAGTVVVSWRAGGRVKERDVAVRAAGGLLHMGENEVVGAGKRRLMKNGGDWQLLWSNPASSATPDPGRKYRFRVLPGAVVAARPTVPVAIERAGQSVVRERLYFDRATGLLLRRDQLDADGRLTRRVAFTEITEPVPVARADRKDGDRLAAGAESRPPRQLDAAPDGVSVHRELGNGFVLLGMYAPAGGGAQLYYSDGLFGLTLFEAAGDLEWGELPAGGREIELAGVDTRLYATAVGAAVVWEDEDVSYTCVTDAPLDEVTAVVDDLERRHEPNTLEDIGRFVTAPFSWG
jgi:sigma-E factor negative regulatory protein RseB